MRLTAEFNEFSTNLMPKLQDSAKKAKQSTTVVSEESTKRAVKLIEDLYFKGDANNPIPDIFTKPSGRYHRPERVAIPRGYDPNLTPHTVSESKKRNT